MRLPDIIQTRFSMTASHPAARSLRTGLRLSWPALLVASLLLSAACSRTAPPDVPASALQPFRRGVQAFQDEDYPHAARLFEQAVALDDRSPVIYYDLGLAYYMLEAYPEAIEAYHKALRLDPKFADAHMNLALAYDRTYDLEQANAQYNEFLALIRSSGPANGPGSGAPSAPGRDSGMGASGGLSGKGGTASGLAIGASGTASLGSAAPGKGISAGSSQASRGSGQGSPGLAQAGSVAAGESSVKPGKAASGGQAQGGLQPAKGQPETQRGRRPSSAVYGSPRAPVSELRRLPADDGKPSAPKSTDPNSSASNAWWTQDVPPRTR